MKGRVLLPVGVFLWNNHPMEFQGGSVWCPSPLWQHLSLGKLVKKKEIKILWKQTRGTPHFICANTVWKSIPPRACRSRQVTDPIEQLDAGSFISLTRQIKKRERKRKVPGLELRVGRWGRVKHQHPQPKALLAQGHGTETPWSTGNQGNGSRFTPRAEPGLWHRVGRREGASVKPRESGTNLISRGFGSGSDLKSKEGFVLWSYFHHLNLQYLYVCKKVIIKPMLNLCPSPFWESTVRSNTKNPNCKALFYCLFSTFLTLNCHDIEIPLIPRLLALY